MKSCLLSTMIMLLACSPLFAQYQITGDLKKWHKVTITFDGPNTTETADTNPFTDYRLNVTFTNGDQTFVVPGYYAADGNAAESSATGGNKWRVHFSPNAIGQWSFQTSFRQGQNIAANDGANAGSPTSFDGTTATFQIEPTDKTGRDNRGQGRLQYVGQHYLQFAETGAYFLKVGADAPENFLAYNGFDNTPDNGNRRKSWEPHIKDWNAGDATWKNEQGKGIIGAVNYLAEEGQNAFSFLSMNIGGDDKNVFPYISDNQADRLRFDCSKLDQWEIVFEHADQKGMYLHFKTQETENDQLLDGGALGTERKIYYRELIARFGHHLALNWNIGEENTNTEQERKAFAQYFYDHDPYRHHVVIHTYPGQIESVYNQLVGDQSLYTGVSIQTGWAAVHQKTLDWVKNSAASGRKWVVANDEQGNAQIGVPHDGYTQSPSQDNIRNTVLYGNLMAGGAGVEYYFGYSLPESDLSCQDFRSRDRMWDYNRYAHQFFTQYTEFWKMTNHNELIGNGNNNNDKYCFATPGETYAIYTDGEPVELDLESYGTGDNNGAAGAFEETNGLLIIEAESETASAGWSEKTANGVTFYEASSNHFGNTNGGKIDYQLSVSTPGVYRFQYKTNIIDGQSATEHNDTWVKFPNNEDVHYFAFKGGINNEQAGINAVNNGNTNLYYPAESGRTPTFNGSNPGKNGYFKLYRSGAGGFKWDAKTIDNNGFPVYVYFKKAGTYPMTLSERSIGHKVDRIALYKVDQYGTGIPASVLDSSPESPRTQDGGNNNPSTAGFNVQWFNPRTGGTLQAGSVVSVSGPGKVSLGTPPSDPNEDWVILVTAGEITCPAAGTTCNDGDPATFNDVQDGDCNCQGTPCPSAGTACDDGNPNTENDQEDGLCNCSGTIPGSATDIWLEAECAAVGTQWTIQTDNQAANGQYVLPPSVAPSLDTPPAGIDDLVTFTFVAAQAGDYKIFARTLTIGDGDDSFWVRANNGTWQAWNKINFGNQGNIYQWSQVGNWTGGDNVNLVSFPLQAGENTVDFAWREPNARLDKIFVSLNRGEPVGLGGDGTANCQDCPAAGTACDDGDPNTINDQEDGNCNCIGTPVECPEAETACDDDNPATFNDLEDGNCNCVGTPCPEAGTACDDGDPNTTNDQEDGNCNCIGTPIDGSTDIWLEAECAAVGARWSLQADSEASNLQYLLPPLESTSLNFTPSTIEDLVTFTFTIPVAGDYKVFARTLTTNDGDDSFWVRVNEGEWLNWNKINFGNYSSQYQWSQIGNWTEGDEASLVTAPLKVGENKIDFAWREPHIRLDKLFITLDGSTPEGQGEDGTTNCTDCPVVGTACDDGNPSSANDTEGGSCNCIGVPCPVIGTPCDDDNPDTTSDIADGQCGCKGTPVGGGLEVWLEAECAEVGSKWSELEDEQASNGRYLMPPTSTNYDSPSVNPEDLVSFNFELAVAGEYLIFARTMTLDENGNSFWVRVDEGDWIAWNAINLGRHGNVFQWDAVGNWTGGNVASTISYDLEAGPHTVQFSWREGGSRLDKIVLSEGVIAPEGIGTEASNCTISTSIHEQHDPSYFKAKIFPNPSDGKFVLLYSVSVPTNPNGSQLSARLLDLFGRSIKTWKLIRTENGRMSLDTGQLPAGSYQLQLMTADKFATIPLQIIR